jgi:hypothetical protein
MRRKADLLIVAGLLAALLIPGLSYAAGPALELEVTSCPTLVFDGDLVPVEISVSNAGDAQASGVKLQSSNGESRVLGTIETGATREATLYLNSYAPGSNEVDVFATHSTGATERWMVRFEVRPPEEAVTLRILDAPHSIYEGMVFVAQLQIQNLRQAGVSGARIMNGEDVVYYVGALNPNESLELALRIDDYEIGVNRLQLAANHELGTAPPVDLQFEVVPAESAVRAYLSSLSPSTYASEKLDMSIVVAAPEGAEVADLEILALSDGVQPAGYYLGDQVAAQEEVDVLDVGSLLTGSQPDEQEEVDRVVRGRELTFEVADVPVGNQDLEFQLSYRLGSSVVKRVFTVDTTVLAAPSVHLIRAERVVATQGEDAIVTLHVANDLPVKVDAVRVVPLADVEVSPSEFFIGGMSPDDFLPAHFRVPTEDLEDGHEIGFKVVYRVGHQTYESPPLATVLHLEEANGTNPAFYIVPPIAVALAIAAFWYLRSRRQWTR